MSAFSQVNQMNLNGSANSKKKSDWSSTIDTSFNTDTRTTSDGDKGYNTQLWYFLRYKINSTYSARLWVDITKDFADSFEEKLNDTRLTLIHSPLSIIEKVKMIPSVSVVLPTSEASKRNQEMIMGVELNPTLAYKATDKLSFSYLPRLVKNFHEYTTTRDNKTNTEYKIIQFYSMNYSITDKWYFGPTLIYSTSWSYSGRRRNPAYLSVLETGYSILDNLTVATGIQQGGTIFDQQNGPDNNIEIFDENATTYYGNFKFTF